MIQKEMINTISTVYNKRFRKLRYSTRFLLSLFTSGSTARDFRFLTSAANFRKQCVKWRGGIICYGEFNAGKFISILC